MFLFAFSAERNQKRKLTKPEISFSGHDNLYLTKATVSKLLIQKHGGVANKPKEILDLNELELALNSNQIVKTAQVYVHVNGSLKTDIEQKTPIARVKSNASFYIDNQGSYMPLSSNHTARVPLVTGAVDKNNLKNVFVMANKVQQDGFLKKNVVEINQNKAGEIAVRLRQCPFTVHLGSLNLLDKKINNLKAFYQKALKDGILNSYNNINLQFDNQVVCTKS